MPAKSPDAEPDHIPICSIGASAGGVQALQALFRALPDDLGLAYVVIIHLSPEHPSALADILADCTSMPVHQVTDTPTLERDSVYVIPPDRELVIKGDRIDARNFKEPRGQRAPVDMFFRSVASGRGDGMAVVLSGSGSDGSVGVRAIAEAGGVVFAQDPNEAQFDEMPKNAIATGVVDFVASIPRLAERITEVSKSKDAVRSLDKDSAANELRGIIGFLHKGTGHDFSSYKRTTVLRRVLRRMQVSRSATLEDYAAHLRKTPEEAQELFQDLLISVTQFFRDEAAFESLVKTAFSNMFGDAGDDGIRVWSVGCATGEEAFTLGILLLEEAERRKIKVPIQIFASDLDESALSTGREGRYPRSIETDVSQDRLGRFFLDEGTHYRVRKELRDIVLFASHSVLKDPPFIRLDLILCRNLLIYVERALQEQLLKLFHYALNPGGVLFLGSAETADTSPDLFSPLDRDARLYRAKRVARKDTPELPNRTVAPLDLQKQPAKEQIERATPGGQHTLALETVAPPSILVDDAQQVIHLSPNAGRFILHSEGSFSGKLSDVVRPELRLDLKIALDSAIEQQVPTLTHAMPVAFNGKRRHVAMNILPAETSGNQNRQALVLFLDGGIFEEEAIPEAMDRKADEKEFRRLHIELRAAREALVVSRTEHETAIEDLRAANEELQSINEEYRSTSEELETSKEELRSMNEELQTVNLELKTKLENIATAHSDLQNLTSATEIGTLFLDSKLQIRMFTPPMAELFNITDSDVGRAITDFTHHLSYDGLERDAGKVLRELNAIEGEAQSRDGNWFMMRLRPYRSVEDRIEGVVVTFIDITSRRETEDQLIESQKRYATLFNSIDEGFAIVEVLFGDDGAPEDFRYIEVNDAFERQSGLENVVGKTVRALVPDLERSWIDVIGASAISGEGRRLEDWADPLNRHFEAFVFPVEYGADNCVGILFRDITERKLEEKHRELLTHELSHRVKNSLAVVQSLARQPGPPDQTADELRQRLVGRIQALGRAHDQLLKSNWQSADLGELAEETLAPYAKASARNIRIEGPQVTLAPRQGLGLALVLHELATNASKYGSLSVRNGKLALTWDLSSEGGTTNVVLKWQETDGPQPEAERREGFGSKLVARACTYELEGSVEQIFEPGGFKAGIVFPLDLEQ